MRLSDRPQHVEDVICLRSLEEPLLLVEGEWHSGFAQVFADLDAFLAGTGQYENVLGGQDAGLGAFVLDRDLVRVIVKQLMQLCGDMASDRRASLRD